MKKLILLLTIIAVTFGCSKEKEADNDNLEIQGTAWSRDSSNFKNEVIGLGIDGLGNYSYSTTTSDSEFNDYKLKYVYKKPNIEIKFKDGSNFGNGSINGDKMNLGIRGVYTRYR